MAKWGMTDEALWEVNPKLTIAHISGFGQTGDPAYVSRASFDGIGQAYGCFMEMNGYPDRLPVLAFPQVSDYYAGFMASIGALAGYINAQRTAKATAWTWPSTRPCCAARLLRAELPEHGRAACARGFAQHVERRLRHVHLPGRRAHLHAHPGSRRGARGAAAVRPRVRQRAVPRGTPVISFGSEAGNVLEEAMEAFFGSHTAEEAERLMLEAGVPCSRIYTYEMAERDPHYQARESFTEWKSSYDDGSIRGVNVVPRMKNNPGQIWRGMPLSRRQRGHPRRAGRHARRCRQPLRRTAPQEGERPLRLNEERDKGTGDDVSSSVPSLFRAADRMRHRPRPFVSSSETAPSRSCFIP